MKSRVNPGFLEDPLLSQSVFLSSAVLLRAGLLLSSGPAHDDNLTGLVDIQFNQRCPHHCHWLNRFI